jgi:hypothetical protein
MSEFGTENIKKALGIAIDLGMGIEDHLADDGKVSLTEALSTAVDLAPDIFSVAKNAGELKAELKDWDPAEREEVLVWAIDKFDLDNDRAERAIETGLALLVKFGELINILKAPEE